MDGTEPEDSTPPDQLHVEQDRPVLTILEPKDELQADQDLSPEHRAVLEQERQADQDRATTGFLGFWAEPLKGISPPPQPATTRDLSSTAPNSRSCVLNEAIGWLATGDEAFAARYAGADGKKNRYLDAIYLKLNEVTGDTWTAATKRLQKAVLAGQVGSDRNGPLDPKFWKVRDVTDPEVADVVFVRDDLRRLLSYEGDGPADAAAGSAPGRVTERPKQRKTRRVVLPPERIVTLAAVWVDKHPDGSVKRDDFVRSFQADTNCDRPSALKAYQELPESRRLRRGKPAQQNRP